MSFGAIRWGVLGVGFLLGSVGVKAVCSEPARKLYVQIVSKGLQAKACGEAIVEEAKSNIDDIVAEANYINELEDEEEIEVEVEVEPVKKPRAKAASKAAKKA